MATNSESFQLSIGTEKCNLTLDLTNRSAMDGSLTKFAKMKTKNVFTIGEVKGFAKVYNAFADRLDVENAPVDLLKQFGEALARSCSKVVVARGDVTKKVRVDASDAAEFKKVIESFKKTLGTTGGGSGKSFKPTTPEEFEELKMTFCEKALVGELEADQNKKYSNLFCQKLLRLSGSNTEKMNKWGVIYKELKGLSPDSDPILDSMDVFLTGILNSDSNRGKGLNVPPPNSQNVTFSGCLGYCWSILGGETNEDFKKFNILAKLICTKKQGERFALITDIEKMFPRMKTLTTDAQGINNCPYRLTQTCFTNRLSNVGSTLKLFRAVSIDRQFVQLLICMNRKYEELGVTDEERNSNQILHESLFNSKNFYEVDNFVQGSTARVSIEIR